MGYEITLRNIEVDKAAKELGAEIAALRVECGASYRQIMMETGVDYSTLKRIENGGDVFIKSYLKVYKFLKG